MNFLSIQFVYSFLLIIPLIAVYFFKVRPQLQQSTTFFLWEQILRKKQSRSFFRKLRDLFSLLILLSATIALCLAMMNPVAHMSNASKNLILIIDNSSSMAAANANSTNLEIAKAKAKKIIRDLSLDTRVMLITANSSLHYKAKLSNDHKAILDAIDKIRTTELPLNEIELKGLLQHEQTYLKNHISFISDACFDPNILHKNTQLIPVPASDDANVGFVAFDIQKLPDVEKSLGIFFQITSTFHNKQTASIRFSCNGQLQRIREVEIKPGLNSAEFFSIPQGSAGQWIAEIELYDKLISDNKAFAYIKDAGHYSLAIANNENAFFHQLILSAFEHHNIKLTAAKNAPADITIAHASLPKGTTGIVFNPNGSSHLWLGNAAGTTMEPTAVKVRNPLHPLNRFGQIKNLVPSGWHRIKAPKGSIVLAEANDGTPLIYKSDQVYIMNFDPEASEFFLSSSYPLIMHIIIEDLLGRESSSWKSLKTGDFYPNPRRQKLSFIHSSKTTISSDSEMIGPFKNPGFYSIADANNSEVNDTISVSHLHASESGAKAMPNIKVTNDLKNTHSWSRYLMLLALALIILESILYHKRKVG